MSFTWNRRTHHVVVTRDLLSQYYPYSKYNDTQLCTNVRRFVMFISAIFFSAAKIAFKVNKICLCFFYFPYKWMWSNINHHLHAIWEFRNLDMLVSWWNCSSPSLGTVHLQLELWDFSAATSLGWCEVSEYDPGSRSVSSVAWRWKSRPWCDTTKGGLVSCDLLRWSKRCFATDRKQISACYITPRYGI